MDDNALTQRAAADLLPIDLKRSRSTVCRALKKMNWTRKRLKRIPVDRNSSLNINRRAEYSIDLSTIADENLVFIDESGFNLHLSSFYGYAPTGLTPTLNVPSNNGRNLSLIAAINVSGMICGQIIVGAYNSEQ